MELAQGSHNLRGETEEAQCERGCDPTHSALECMACCEGISPGMPKIGPALLGWVVGTSGTSALCMYLLHYFN